MDFAVDHFADTRMLRGTTAQWDEIFQNHPQARVRLLERFRCPWKVYIKSMEYYLEVNETKVDSRLRMDVGLAGLSITEKKTEVSTTAHAGNNKLNQVSNSPWKHIQPNSSQIEG